MMRTLFPALVFGLFLGGCESILRPDRFEESTLALAPETPPADPAPRARRPRSKPLLIMFDVTSSSIDQGSLDALSQRLWHELLRTGRFLMVTREDTQRLLDDRSIVLHSPYREPLPLALVGRSLQADYLITGEIGTVGSTQVLDMSLLDVTRDRIVSQGSATAHGEIDVMVDLIPQIAAAVTRTFGPRISPRPAPPARPAPEPAPPLREPEVVERAPEPEPPAPRVVPDPVAEPVTTPEPAPAPPPAEPDPEPAPTVAVIVTAEPPATAPAAVPDDRPASLVRSLSEPVELGTPEPVAEVVPDGDVFLPDESADEPPPAPAEVTPEPDEPVDVDRAINEAHARMREALAGAASSHGTEPTDVAQAEQLVQDAQIYPDDSPLRASMLERALEFNPLDPGTLAMAARSHALIGEHDRAIDECLTALSVQPNDSFVYTILGSVYHQQGDVFDAVAAQERALEIDEGNHYAQYNMALSLWQVDRGRARRAFQRYIEMAGEVDGQGDFIEEARGHLATRD